MTFFSPLERKSVNALCTGFCVLRIMALYAESCVFYRFWQCAQYFFVLWTIVLPHHAMKNFCVVMEAGHDSSHAIKSVYDLHGDSSMTVTML